MTSINVLELFSGIGGMHFALKASGVSGKILTAVDINTIANTVYEHNYPSANVVNRNVQYLTAEFIDKLNIDTILMSPPCQPFTRVGNMKDVEDPRTDAFIYICDLLPQLTKVNKILMENVMGFETSRARDYFIEALKKSGFHYQEFLLTPTIFGVPNSRNRYYCIARKDGVFSFSSDELLKEIPGKTFNDCRKIDEFLDSSSIDELHTYAIPDETLRKRVQIMDIRTPESTNTICFTKAYTRYTEGTGSVLTNHTQEYVNETFTKLKLIEQDSSDYLQLLKELNLRYFTPMEVARLMSFPLEFQFPDKVTKKQKYRLLGNSINVLVVSELIKLLCEKC